MNDFVIENGVLIKYSGYTDVVILAPAGSFAETYAKNKIPFAAE